MSIFSLTTNNLLSDLRITVNDFLTEKKINAQRVITVQTFQTPIRVLNYSYYGNSENIQQIVDLNENINVSYYSGDVKVLSS